MSVRATRGIIFDQASKELSQTEISDIGTIICLLFWLWKLNNKFVMPTLPKYSCKLMLGNLTLGSLSVYFLIHSMS